MNIYNVLILLFLVESFVAHIIFIVLFKRNYNIKKKNRKPLPQHKHSIKAPTWKFQKFHPSKCPHHTGVYRKVKYQILEESFEKLIFICADCVSAVEIYELNQKDNEII